MPIAYDTADIVSDVLPSVVAAGEMALEAQSAIQFTDRAYKPDDSVITEADRQVEDFLVEKLAGLSPPTNVITEESAHHFDPQRPLTIAIDPIDGTDVFSQGMPGWCVSVGLLDRDLVPIGGIIIAPRLNLLIVADGDGPATLNGSPLPAPRKDERISVRSNLMVTSRIHKNLDLSGYVGKIRGIGSAALHLCYPLIYPAVIGALEGPGVHIWDIAGAHAIHLAQGQDLSYLSAEPIRYAPMVGGGPAEDVVMAGSEPLLGGLREILRRLVPAPN